MRNSLGNSRYLKKTVELPIINNKVNISNFGSLCDQSLNLVPLYNWLIKLGKDPRSISIHPFDKGASMLKTIKLQNKSIKLE